MQTVSFYFKKEIDHISKLMFIEGLKGEKIEEGLQQLSDLLWFWFLLYFCG